MRLDLYFVALLFSQQLRLSSAWTIDGTFDASGVAVVNDPAFGAVAGGTLTVDIEVNGYQPGNMNTTVAIYDWFDPSICISSPTPNSAVIMAGSLSYTWTFDSTGPVILVINDCLCGAFYCKRPDLTSVKVHAVFKNPGGDLLGIYLKPTPGVYTALFVVWAAGLAAWLFFALRERTRATRLHWAVALFAAARLPALLCAMIQWWSASHSGLLSTVLPYSPAQAVLETVFTCVMWSVLVFLAADHDSTFRLNSCPGYYRVATGVLVGIVVFFQILYAVGLVIGDSGLLIQGLVWGHIFLWSLLIVWFCQIRRTHLDAQMVEINVVSQHDFQTAAVLQTNRIKWATPEERLIAYRHFFVFVPTFVLLASIGLGIMELIYLLNDRADLWGLWLAQDIYYFVIWLLLCVVFRIRPTSGYAPLVGGAAGPHGTPEAVGQASPNAGL